MRQALVAVALSLAVVGCRGTSRFALRPPVVRERDDAPFARAPDKDEESDVMNAVDGMALRPLSQAFVFEVNREATDVNALDEVPDSSWYQNRSVAPEALWRGPCPDAGPIAPFSIETTKVGGVTPGFVVLDARGQKYVLKLDELGKYGQPEISTAADVIVSRLYWAIGFNAPCNDITEVSPGDIRVGPHSVEVATTGQKKKLTQARVLELLKGATPTASGRLRISASRFIEGKGIGTWRAEGRRRDNPNDRIPHQNRRELRGELFLAAWTAHWDSRGQNTYDSFASSCGGGHVVHYFLDFSDALGGTISRTAWPEPRSGYESVLSFGNIATDAIGFGFVRRPWDELTVDPRYPDLGYLDVEHFDPVDFSPQTPLVRWAHADAHDLAWMARKIARIDARDLVVAIAAGHLTRPGEAERLLELMLGRRARILRISFAQVSPLTDASFRGDALCVTDLARATKMASDAQTSYLARLQVGEQRARVDVTPGLSVTPGRLCLELPHYAAARGAPIDDASRYRIVDLFRFQGGRSTVLHVHFYDLGDRFVLAGLARD